MTFGLAILLPFLHHKARSGLAPAVTGRRQRIDRVDDDRVAEAEIVLREIASCKYPSGLDTVKRAFPLTTRPGRARGKPNLGSPASGFPITYAVDGRQ